MQKWEYKSVMTKGGFVITDGGIDLPSINPLIFGPDSYGIDKYFSKLGAEGWELVSSTADDPMYSTSTFVFKRPINE